MTINEKRENPKQIDDQSILLFHLSELAEESKQMRAVPVRFTRPGRFNNLCVLDFDPPYLLNNFLFNPEKDCSSMLRLTTLQVSLLTPRIKIFKVVYNSSSKKELEIELPFDDVSNKNDLEKIFNNSAGRGTGAGIKTFKWKTMAKNQASLAQFSATLSLYIQNIEEFTKVRNSKTDTTTGKTFDVTIMDLLHQKPDLRGGFNEGTNVYDPKYFGIKVEVGWHLDRANYDVFKNESKKYGDDPNDVIEAIENQKQVFYLTLISHSFNILEDGGFDLSIDYIATAEAEATDLIQANILRLDEKTEKVLKNLNERYKMINRQIAYLEINQQKTDLDTSLNSDTGLVEDIFTSIFAANEKVLSLVGLGNETRYF